MNELYRTGSKATPRSTAQTTNGRTNAVSGLTTMRCSCLPAGQRRARQGPASQHADKVKQRRARILGAEAARWDAERQHKA